MPVCGKAFSIPGESSKEIEAAAKGSSPDSGKPPDVLG